MPKNLKITLILVAVALASPAAASASRPVYVSDNGADEIAIFNPDAAGALLAPPTHVPSDDAEGTVLTPDGKFLYVVDNTTGVRGYSVGAGGSLAELPGSPFAVGGGSAYGITVMADGKHLYTAYNGVAPNIYGFSIGADGSLTATTGSPYSAGTDPFGLAGAPDSKSLYVVDTNLSDIRAFTVAADGSLTANGTPVATGAEPYYAIVAPDGKRVYTADYSGDSISGYAVQADGTLVALAGSPYLVVNGPYAGMAMTADGKHLYVTSYDDGNVAALAIAADGSLTAIGAPTPAGSEPNGAGLSPDGKHLYVAAGDSQQVFSFDVQSTGSLAANGTPAALDPAGYADFQSVAIGADQPPAAAVTTKASKGAIEFDASASTDPDGTVASYAWDFGDGQTETTTSPKTSHKYAKAGDYSATVTLTDNEGCSTKLIYTGQATLCNGSAVATKSTPVDSGVVGAKVKAKKTQKQKGSLKIVVMAGAKENAKLVASGSASFKGVKDKIALKKAKGKAKAGKTKTLKLKAKKKDQGKAVVGFKGKAKITVKLTDDAGNVVSKKLSVKLK